MQMLLTKAWSNSSTFRYRSRNIHRQSSKPASGSNTTGAVSTPTENPQRMTNQDTAGRPPILTGAGV